MQPNLTLAKPSSPGRLVNFTADERIKKFIQAFIGRIEGVEGNSDSFNRRLNQLEARLAALEGNRTVAYTAKRRQAGKYGVNDAIGGAVEQGPLTKSAAEWLAQHLNDAGAAVSQEEWRTLMNLATRKSEDAA